MAAKYGEAVFCVSGLLEAVPVLETTQNGLQFAKFVLIVNTYDSKNKTDQKKYIPITVWGPQAKRMTDQRYIKQNAFFTVSGTVKAREWVDKNGNDQLTPELTAGKIMGGN